MTKKQSKDKRINDIIGSSVRLFLEYGYENTSMQMIAEAAGLTKGGLYHHFSSKDEILLTASEFFMLPVYRMMDEAIVEKDVVEGFKSFIRKVLDHWNNKPDALKFTFLTFSKMLSVPEWWEEMDKYIEKLQSFYEYLLKKGIRSGRFREHDTRARAIAIMAAMDGITAGLVMSSKFDPAQVAKDFINVFVDELIPSKRSE
jgi:AcrR family transcriptional regulator